MTPLSAMSSTSAEYASVPAKLDLGFLVRVPVEEREDEDFREHRLGRICDLEDEFGEFEVELLDEAISSDPVLNRRRFPAALIERCHVLPDSPFQHIDTGERGRVLLAASNQWPIEAPIDYYALIDGEVVRVPETCIRVGSTYQDPDPIRQLQRYELHNPVYKSSRDYVVEAIAELHNATYGLAELVAARVHLIAHQADVVARVLASDDRRFILADEVGLGKTIEAGLILKGLRRRDPALRVLVVAPDSLVHQWQRELDDRFWLRFHVRDEDGFSAGEGAGLIDRRGLIVSAESLRADRELQKEVRSLDWGLLIVDEAHQVRRDPRLTTFLRWLSQRAGQTLLLSATPVQRHAQEYIDLLRLLDPERYERVTDEHFARLLESQSEVRRTVSYLARGLDPELFDADEFMEEIAGLVERLSDDDVLGELIAAVAENAQGYDRGLAAAGEAIAYLSENYRIESRMIRNRRAHLDAVMPTRELDDAYLYDPTDSERDTLEALFDYLVGLKCQSGEAVASEYTRLLMHAAASSPAALLGVVRQRLSARSLPPLADESPWPRLLAPTSPRHEPARVAELIRRFPPWDDLRALQTVALLAQRWNEEEEEALAANMMRRKGGRFPQSSRLGQALTAIEDAIGERRQGKVLVFSSWPETLDSLAAHIERAVGPKGAVSFRAGLTPGALQEAAERFQSDPTCRVLLSDELGGEGRNFQIADAIVHLDLPWTPALVEQRIGRVDRIGREGTVRSIVIAARGTPEDHLFQLWHQAFQLFTRSMSGLEMALESIQDELATALLHDLRQGLAELLEPMQAHVAELRELVEEEAFFDQGAINRRLRDDFTAMSARFGDGTSLRHAITRWGNIAGLLSDYDPGREVVTYAPKRFVASNMEIAGVVTLPNMEEAIRRSRRRNSLEVRGTFNRVVAVAHEELVFFSPGSDPWTDTIINNALAASRGRSCAVMRKDAPVDWTGIELLYTLAIDPRPLFALGCDPTRLFEGQGYLRVPTYRVLISRQGDVIDMSHPAARAIAESWRKGAKLEHLGKRGRNGEHSNLDTFRRMFPLETWPDEATRLERQARGHLRDEFSFLADEAESAREIFGLRERGQRAAARWFRSEAENAVEFEAYRDISSALVEGIRNPLIRLESACFWLLRSPKESV